MYWFWCTLRNPQSCKGDNSIGGTEIPITKTWMEIWCRLARDAESSYIAGYGGRNTANCQWQRAWTASHPLCCSKAEGMWLEEMCKHLTHSLFCLTVAISRKGAENCRPEVPPLFWTKRTTTSQVGDAERTCRGVAAPCWPCQERLLWYAESPGANFWTNSRETSCAPASRAWSWRWKEHVTAALTHLWLW